MNWYLKILGSFNIISEKEFDHTFKRSWEFFKQIFSRPRYWQLTLTTASQMLTCYNCSTHFRHVSRKAARACLMSRETENSAESLCRARGVKTGAGEAEFVSVAAPSAIAIRIASRAARSLIFSLYPTKPTYIPERLPSFRSCHPRTSPPPPQERR